MRSRQFIGALFFFLMTACLSAQAPAINPFDIVGRLPKNIKDVAEAAANNMSAVSDTTPNPFNIVAHRAPGAAPGLSESIERTFRPLEVLPTGDALSDKFIFWLLITLVAFLSLAVTSKRNIVLKSWQGFLNDNALSIAQKEASGLRGSTPYYLLYASFLLHAGAFIFLIARHFDRNSFNNFGMLLICIALSAALFLSKHALLGLVQWLYPVEKEIRRYNFMIMLFNCVLGLFLVPFNFMIVFIRAYGDFMVYWTLALAGIFYLYRSIRAAAIGQKFLGGNLFHFLLYLCTVEIAPVILLIKLVMLASN